MSPFHLKHVFNFCSSTVHLRGWKLSPTVYNASYLTWLDLTQGDAVIKLFFFVFFVFFYGGNQSFIMKVATGSCISRTRQCEGSFLCSVLVQLSPLTKMTARKSGSRLETEIERCRSEGQWDKIPELVRQLSAKLISNGKKCSGCSFIECVKASSLVWVLGTSWQRKPWMWVLQHCTLVRVS